MQDRRTRGARHGSRLRPNRKKPEVVQLQNPCQAEENPYFAYSSSICFPFCRRKGYSKAVAAAMADIFPPLTAAQVDAKIKVDEKVDYSNLPCPVPYEELHREALSSVFSKSIFRSSFLIVFFLLLPFLLKLYSLISQFVGFLIWRSNECGFECIVLSFLRFSSLLFELGKVEYFSRF